MDIDLRISGVMYETLRNHLFPGDGKESIAIAVCGTLLSDDSVKVMVHKLVIIPKEDCLVRSEGKITWRTEKLIDALPLASQKKFSILKIHSHPTGYQQFSETDDKADAEIFAAIFSWIDDVEFHVSAVMLPDGQVFGRAIRRNGSFQSLKKL